MLVDLQNTHCVQNTPANPWCLVFERLVIFRQVFHIWCTQIKFSLLVFGAPAGLEILSLGNTSNCINKLVYARSFAKYALCAKYSSESLVSGVWAFSGVLYHFLIHTFLAHIEHPYFCLQWMLWTCRAFSLSRENLSNLQALDLHTVLNLTEKNRGLWTYSDTVAIGKKKHYLPKCTKERQSCKWVEISLELLVSWKRVKFI